MSKRKVKSTLATAARTFILFLCFIFFMFPIVWVFLASIKKPVEQVAIPPKWIPSSLDFNNYMQLFSHPDFLSSLVNSIIIASITTIVTVLLGSFAAYAIERFRVGGSLLPSMILTTRMIPPVVIIIPIFLLAYNLNLLDTHFLLILTYCALNIALAIWLLRDFFATVPNAIEEAALIDGCNRWQVLWKVVLPVILPGLMSTSLIIFIFSWNEFIFALTLSGDLTKTLPVLISTFVSQKGMDRGVMSAAGIVSSIPIILVAIFFQKYLISGLTKGSVK